MLLRPVLRLADFVGSLRTNGTHDEPSILSEARRVAAAESKEHEKAKWMLTDLERWATQYAVPFKMSCYWPINAIKAMRLIVAAEPHGKAELATLAAFRAAWVDERDLTAEAELRAIAGAAGIPGDPIALIEQQPIKDRLRAYGDEAVRKGAFGAPAIFVRGPGGDELFWGNDRLHHVEAALQR